jgi:hypothetical protein
MRERQSPKADSDNLTYLTGGFRSGENEGGTSIALARRVLPPTRRTGNSSPGTSPEGGG